jgi:hypothetical protein
MNEKDAEILDYIVRESLTKYCLHAEDLKPLSTGILSNSKDIKERNYSYYFNILKEKNVVKVENGFNSQTEISQIDFKTKEFLMQGGFKAIVEENNRIANRNNESDKLSFEKLQLDSKLSKWQVKTFWWIFSFGIIGGVYAIISIVIAFTGETIDQKIERILESKLKAQPKIENTSIVLTSKKTPAAK